ncbi:MAG TPA: LuxR C-terminal-related transcriptional regulator [Anaerolineales bacterium]|nr:LuxR C-terminal-related transcriptional regulator [Anaerolineales bacterium]
MAIWQRVLRALGYASATTRLEFHADEDLLQSLQTIAEHEQRRTGEVASELLSSALARRQVDDGLLSHWCFLSPREQQVAALTCLNFTNRQIAAKLVVTPETAKTHVRNVLRKFDLHSKAELRRALADWDFSAWLH